MQYDFTTIMDRRGKDAIAVDAPAGNNTGNDFFAGAKIREGFDLIPMWVADMKFSGASGNSGGDHPEDKASGIRLF